MASIDDDSIAMENFHLNESLKVRKRTLPQVGHCYFCSEQISIGVFCDSECSKDYELQLAAKIREGKL